MAAHRAPDPRAPTGLGSDRFAIRTRQVRLGALAERPVLCLAAAARAWMQDLLAYRGGEPVRRPLVAWLDAHAGST